LIDGVLVTGGAGYLGVPVVEELLHTGRDVRVLDVFLHEQRELVAELRRHGIDVVQADVRGAPRWMVLATSSIWPRLSEIRRVRERRRRPPRST
jgi:nucleoside-diphosphate-sugar epimerase